MKDFQTAETIRQGQRVSFLLDGEWTDPRQVIHVQHNRLCGRTPKGEAIRGVVVLLEGRKVASLDEDTIVRVEMETVDA